MDHIVKNVESANSLVSNGKINVTHAVTYKKSSQRKKRNLMLAAVSCFGLIFLIILFIFFANFFSNSAKL